MFVLRALALVLTLWPAALQAGPADALEAGKAESLARPAVLEIQASALARVVFSHGEKSLAYGPYRLPRQGLGLVLTPDGFTLTGAALVTPQSGDREKILELFYRHMDGAYAGQLGRELSERERQRLRNLLQSRGQLSLVDSRGGLIADSDELPMEIILSPLSEDRGSWSHRAEIRWISPPDRKGLAILKAQAPLALPTARFAEAAEPALHDVITAWRASDGKTVSGHLVSFETWRDGSPVLDVEMEASAGDGLEGPAFNSRAEFVGFLTSNSLEARAQGRPGVILRPMKTIEELLRVSGVVPSPGPSDARFAVAVDLLWSARESERTGSIGEARRRYAAGLDVLAEILAAHPQHVEARRHARWTIEKLDSLPWGGLGRGFLLGATAALIMTAMAGLVILILRIRRAG